MIEWHEWWSVDIAQADLIAPLKDAGFFVFDRRFDARCSGGERRAIRTLRQKS
jgi:hypothetical protein